jgi:transposase
MKPSSSWSPVGIDVSKDRLDLAIFTPSRPLTSRFANHPHDFAALLSYLQARVGPQLHVCLEATGTYHDALVAFLIQQGVRVSVLPSARLKAFRESEGIRSKTDKLDAVLLARYCQQKQPTAFVPVPEDLAFLRVLLARLNDLTKMRHQETCRLENQRLDEELTAQIKAHLKLLDDWHQQLLKRIRAWIKTHEDLRRAVKLVQTIPGIGERTAWHLVSIVGADASRFHSAHQLVVYSGLDVARADSGKKIKAGHITKQGPSHVRACLGMCAIVSKRWDPDMQQWASELTQRGKKSRQVRVALMRKLLHLAYGVLEHQQPYDCQRAWPTHHTPTQEGTAAA